MNTRIVPNVRLRHTRRPFWSRLHPTTYRPKFRRHAVNFAEGFTCAFDFADLALSQYRPMATVVAEDVDTHPDLVALSLDWNAVGQYIQDAIDEMREEIDSDAWQRK